jgi:hypothetical protein
MHNAAMTGFRVERPDFRRYRFIADKTQVFGVMLHG